MHLRKQREGEGGGQRAVAGSPRSDMRVRVWRSHVDAAVRSAILSVIAAHAFSSALRWDGSGERRDSASCLFARGSSQPAARLPQLCASRELSGRGAGLWRAASSVLAWLVCRTGAWLGAREYVGAERNSRH